FSWEPKALPAESTLFFSRWMRASWPSAAKRSLARAARSAKMRSPARSCATSSHQSSHSAVAYSGCEPTSRYRRAALRRNTFELRPIATTGRNSSRAAASGSSAREPSARTHTRPYSVSRPPTRRLIGSLSALLHEGAHEGLGVRLGHRVGLVEQVVRRLGGGEGLPAGDGVGALLVVGTGAGGVQGLLGHGVLLVSMGSVSGGRRPGAAPRGSTRGRRRDRCRAGRTSRPSPGAGRPGAAGARRRARPG